MHTPYLKLSVIPLLALSLQAPAVQIHNWDFAPQEGQVKAPETTHRYELCLNGFWRFQPLPVPPNYQWDQGVVPALPAPHPERWETTPIKIPSPWNANNWGGGWRVGADTERPFGPDSIYYPSYPRHWIHFHMAWMQRDFEVPATWPTQHRLILHFESIAGDAQIWLNDQLVGTNFDKYLPFALDITPHVLRGRPNTLRVGVRSYRLFDQQDPHYPKMTAPYPNGSNTDRLTGIWQDVSLLALPPIRASEVFVKPWLDRDLLEIELTLQNDTPAAQDLHIVATAYTWLNQAGTNLLEAPLPRWSLGAAALECTATATLAPHSSRTIVLKSPVQERLKTWHPTAPNLYGLVFQLKDPTTQQIIDTKYQRFGWRQFTIDGRHLLLNGTPIQLKGDIIHPFGAYIFSRRFAWAWYTMIKDMHGNAVRPHAQPYPRCYLELADEMGLCVLDETAIFGSSIRSNFNLPEFWQRYADHYARLIKRDRNYPSVFGWSFGNEMFAIFEANKISGAPRDQWYQQLSALGLSARQLDPTRPWIACDGDGDLNGTLPVWSKHYGHGTAPLAADTEGLNKPLMVGENGGTYYARPQDLVQFAGDLAYLDYAGRNQALAVDLYQNITTMARPHLAYFSASETVWFGLEHLPFGYDNHQRPPTLADGIFFVGTSQEGKFGMQIERLPPYVGTLNPGFDATLPLYKPLAMFQAQKAAQHPGAPQPSPWQAALTTSTPPLPPVRHPTVHYLGEQPLRTQLTTWGITLSPPTTATPPLVVVDGNSLAALEKLVQPPNPLWQTAGTILILLGHAPSLTALNHTLAFINRQTPLSLSAARRSATALESDPTFPFSAAQLYFAAEEPPPTRSITHYTLCEPTPPQGRTLLRASRTDWSLFNRRAEEEKCGALFCYEQLSKPDGAVLVEYTMAHGRLLLATMDLHHDSPARRDFWQHLFRALGVAVHQPQDTTDAPQTAPHDLILDGPPPL